MPTWFAKILQPNSMWELRQRLSVHKSNDNPAAGSPKSKNISSKLTWVSTYNRCLCQVTVCNLSDVQLLLSWCDLLRIRVNVKNIKPRLGWMRGISGLLWTPYDSKLSVFRTSHDSSNWYRQSVLRVPDNFLCLRSLQAQFQFITGMRASIYNSFCGIEEDSPKFRLKLVFTSGRYSSNLNRQ